MQVTWSRVRGAKMLSVVVALFLLALSVLLIVSALGIRRGGGFSVVGPQTVPLAVSIGLLGLAAVFAARTTIRVDTDLTERAAGEERATHWPTVGLVLALLVAYAFLLDGARFGALRVPGVGYVLATALFLPAGARILGSRALLRDALIGLVLAVAVYLAFTQFLGVRLPAGVLDFVLP
jgi:putative tricarboxylic transport membrane protein